MTQDGVDAVAALAERVVAANSAAGRTVALAESCTGGMVCAAITGVAGSSAVLLAGFVTYANAAKTALVGVPESVLATHGAVSEECARHMAAGAVARGEADVAVAITGVAGPGGGSAAKPVGLVVFARAFRGQAASQAETRVHRFDAALGRAEIRRQATLVALELLLP